MTIAEIANFICGKVNQTEDEDVSAAKGFARRRFELIWNDQLWKDSVICLEKDWQYTTMVGAAGIDFLPSSVDRVLAVRCTDRAMYPAHETLYFRVDPDQYAQTGTPWEFAELPPCCWMTMGDQGATIVSTTASDDGKTVEISYMTMFQERHTVTVTLDYNGGHGVLIEPPTGQSEEVSQSLVREIYSITKPATIGRLAIAASGYSNESQLLLAANQLTAPLLPRMRLFPIPDTAVTLRVMAKMKSPTLADNDVIPLRSIENCLCAFVHGDMLQRERQYAKADLIFREATALLDQAKKIETVQMATSMRVLPENGVGCPNEEYMDPGTSWMTLAAVSGTSSSGTTTTTTTTTTSEGSNIFTCATDPNGVVFATGAAVCWGTGAMAGALWSKTTTGYSNSDWVQIIAPA